MLLNELNRANSEKDFSNLFITKKNVFSTYMQFLFDFHSYFS